MMFGSTNESHIKWMKIVRVNLGQRRSTNKIVDCSHQPSSTSRTPHCISLCVSWIWHSSICGLGSIRGLRRFSCIVFVDCAAVRRAHASHTQPSWANKSKFWNKCKISVCAIVSSVGRQINICLAEKTRQQTHSDELSVKREAPNVTMECDSTLQK